MPRSMHFCFSAARYPAGNSITPPLLRIGSATGSTQLRREIFADNFPASALITVAGLARPEMLVEVQGVAVAG